jgi:hypothetical protein
MASGPTLPPQAYTREVLTSAFNWLQTQPESVKKLATTPDALVGLYLRAQRYGASSLEADAPVSSQNFMSDLKNLAEGLKQFEDPKERRAMNSAINAAGTHPSMATTGAAPLVAHHSQIGVQQNYQSHHPAASLPQAQTSAHQGGMASHETPNFNTTQSNSLTNAQLAALQANLQASLQSLQSTTQQVPSYPPGQGTTGYGQVPMNFNSVSTSVQTNPAPISQSRAVSPVLTSLEMLNSPGILSERTQMIIHEVKATFNLSSDAEAINLMVALAYKSLKNLLS